MAVLFGRLIRQEVLDESHALDGAEGRDDQLVGADTRLEAEVGARGPCVAIGFGVRIASGDVLVLVDLRPLNEAGGFLVEVHDRKARHGVPVLAAELRAERELLLFNTGRIAPAAIIHQRQTHPVGDAVGGEVSGSVRAIALQGVGADRQRLALLGAGLGVDEVDEAVNGVRPVANRCGATHDLDCFGGLVMQLEQRVDVAEARSARGGAVLQDEEGALPGARRQNRRADRNQQLLSGVHLHVHAWHSVEDFSGMVGGHARNGVRVDDRIGAGVSVQPVAVDDDDIRVGRRRGWIRGRAGLGESRRCERRHCNGNGRPTGRRKTLAHANLPQSRTT